MFRSRKAIVCAVLTLVLLMGTTVASAKTTITFWHAMGSHLGETVDALVQKFNETHTDIQVKAEYQGNYGALNQKLIGAVAAKNPPTLAQMYSNWTDQLIAAKAIVPAQKFIDGPNGYTKEELADFFPVFLEANTWNNTIWTMPFNKSVYVMVYNKTMFEEKGVKVPTNWAELIRAAQALTVRKPNGEVETYGIGLRSTIDQWALFFLVNGGKWLTDDYTKVLFNGPEGVEALQFMVDLVHKYKLAYYQGGYMDQDFAKGLCAMYYPSSAGRPYAENAVGDKFELGIAPVPVYKEQVTPIAGTDLGIFAQATPEQQEAAWTFIKWLLEPEQTAFFSMGSYYLPVRRSAVETPEFQEYLAADPNNGAALALLEYATYDPPITEWYKIRGYLSDAVEEALLLKATPKAALDKAAEKSNKDLAKRK